MLKNLVLFASLETWAMTIFAGPPITPLKQFCGQDKEKYPKSKYVLYL